MKTLIWAHRGASGYAPENTMEAFRIAYKQRADGIELDIHLTKDGHIVVSHDETIDRCSNGTGRIIDKTLEELLTYDFSNKFKNFKNVRIPTLEKVLRNVKETNLTVNIEIKSDQVIYDGIEAKTISLVSKLGLSNRVIYSSFNHYSMKLIKKIDSTIPIGLLYSEAMVDPHVYASHFKANAIHPYFRTLLVPGTISGCKANNIHINAWTVNDPEDMKQMFKEEINAIITNYPDVAYKLRGQMQK